MSASPEAVPRCVFKGDIVADESLTGFVLRLSVANQLPSIAPLISFGASTSRRSVGQLPREKLLYATGAQEASYERATRWPNLSGGEELPQRFRNILRPRVCPKCIDELGYIPRLWDITYYCFCSRHSAPLVDQCPRCCKPLTWFRSRLDACNCGSPIRLLRRQSKERHRDQLMKVSEFLSSLSNEPIAIRRGMMPVETLVDTLTALAFFGSRGSPRQWRSQYLAKPDVLDAEARLRLAAPVLFDWPGQYHSWIDSQRTSLPERATHGISADFAILRRHLMEVCRERPALEFLIDEARSYISGAGHRYFPIKTTALLSAPDLPCPVMYAKEAARILCTRRESIVEMVRSGKLEGPVVRCGKQVMCAVQVTSVISLRREVENYRDIRSVARSLGVSTYHCETLCTARILLTVRWHGGIYVTGPTFDAFVAELNEKSSCVSGEVDLISLTRLTATRAGVFLPTIRGILDGRIQLYSQNSKARLFNRLFVASRDVVGTRYHGSHDTPGIGHHKAAKIIGVNSRQIPSLLAAGCLKTTGRCLPSGKQIKCNIIQSSAEMFNERFRLSSSISIETGCGTKTVLQAARTLRLKAVVQSNSSAGISAVWTASQARVIAEYLRNGKCPAR